jgi:alkylation response protein AidB-like acyl-CoA dehydrogenase
MSEAISDGLATINPFTEEEELFRRTVRAFFDRELEPRYKAFEAAGAVGRDFWLKAGDAGLLGTGIPEEYGGPGGSEMCGLIRAYELGRSIGGATIGSSICADIATNILMHGASDAQKRKWAPGILRGEVLQCMPLTEPDAGSDVTSIRSSAKRDGDHYVINGNKTYISNGMNADLMYVVAKTDPKLRGRGLSMILVEANTPGVRRRLLKTMGYPLYDAAEIFFDDVRVPAENLFLGEGAAFDILFSTFAIDRLEIGARALGEAELAFDLTRDYVKQRKAFGQRVADFQNTQFKLAEMLTDISVGRAFLYDGIRKRRSGAFSLADGAMVKLWLSEMSSRVVDQCVQLFGGAGFMDEVPISRLYKANRLHRIYAGTSELQKVAIAKELLSDR